MIILLILFTTAYAILIGLYAMGWSKIDQWDTPLNFYPRTKVSVLIPARNESQTIAACIESVLNQKGKKGALTHGIFRATGKLIVTTDADCTFDKNWLSTIVSFYESEQKKMIVAPVKFEGPRSFLEKFSQSLKQWVVTGVTCI